MSNKILCTFSGKFGDILWSLPTAKRIAELVGGGKVDFAVMPYYESLLPLLRAQSYIDNAYYIPSWMRTHSNHGDQPWEPPQKVSGESVQVLGMDKAFPAGDGASDLNQLSVTEHTYDRAYHLTYKGHPGITAPRMPLIDFIPWQQGIQLTQRVPFLDAPDCSSEFDIIELSSGEFTDVVKEKRLITYAFNEQYDQMKKEFFQHLYRLLSPDFEFFNAAAANWMPAAWAIQNSLCFVGCRSANWVLAVGLGQTTVTYEPHPARHAKGHLGDIFGYPCINELPVPFGMPPSVAAEVASNAIRSMRSTTNMVTNDAIR